MYIRTVLAYELCSSKHRILRTDLRSSRYGSSTLRKQPPARGWVVPYPVSKSCEETTSWPLFWKHDPKNTAVFSCNIQLRDKELYAILCSYAFNCTENFRTKYIAVFCPETINVQLVNTHTAYCTKPTDPLPLSQRKANLSHSEPVLQSHRLRVLYTILLILFNIISHIRLDASRLIYRQKVPHHIIFAKCILHFANIKASYSLHNCLLQDH